MAVPAREVASFTHIYLEYVDGISAERRDDPLMKRYVQWIVIEQPDLLRRRHATFPSSYIMYYIPRFKIIKKTSVKDTIPWRININHE
jgi:hypothetical protein